MTNTARMTNIKIKAALDEAVSWSNWYFEGEEFQLAEYWHNRAMELRDLLPREMEVPDRCRQ